MLKTCLCGLLAIACFARDACPENTTELHFDCCASETSKSAGDFWKTSSKKELELMKRSPIPDYAFRSSEKGFSVNYEDRNVSIKYECAFEGNEINVKMEREMRGRSGKQNYTCDKIFIYKACDDVKLCVHREQNYTPVFDIDTDDLWMRGLGCKAKL